MSDDTTTGGRAAPDTTDQADSGRHDDGETTRDWSDPAADRGLTADDVAAQAADDAGISAKPRIGDSRPAPPPPPGPRRPKRDDDTPGEGMRAEDKDADRDNESGSGGGSSRNRRRRRGGRGRGRQKNQKGQNQEKRNGGGRGPKKDSRKNGGRVVTADLGIDRDGDQDDLEELDDDVLRRRKGRTRKGRPAGRYFLCVHVADDGSTHIAVQEGRNLVEHYVSRPEDAATSIDGNIYLGRVQNVLPGMEAAFVDFGTPKNGVIYRSDVDDQGKGKNSKIEKLLKNGQTILVQAIKNPIGHKGARLTQDVSLAGRFVVMVPGQRDTYGISKRLPDQERKRLRRVLDKIRPNDAGLIVRTAAEGASPDELRRDVERLQAQWAEIQELTKGAKPPRLVYQEPSLALRIIREEFTREYRGVVIDDRELYEQVRDYVAAITPELADRVEYYDDDTLSVFERHHVHEQLHKALDRKVWLPSGGSLIIERTEALTVIDVNTGKNVGKKNLEQTVFENNLEAADEVARQLRLRDIGGIIVIDFIDMENRSNREKVQERLDEALARDKTRTQAFEITELGLVEMTRKRISEGLVESFSRTCEVCEGRGFIVDDEVLER